MRSRWITLAGIVILTVPLTASASSARRDNARTNKAVPFVTVSSGASTKHPPGNRLFLARSLAATKPWSRWLTADGRNVLRAVDFNRYGVVAAFRLQKSAGLRITRIARVRNTLGLWLAVPKPVAPDPKALTLGAYHVVRVQRRYLRDVSRLVVSGVTVWTGP